MSLLLRHTRLEQLARFNLSEEAFRRNFHLPALIFPVDAKDDDTVETNISQTAKDAAQTDVLHETGEEIFAGSVNNSRVFFLEKTKKNTSNGIVVGRNSNCDIVLSAGTVSKAHAFFWQRGDGNWCVTDCNSSNGTVVNGNKLAPGEITVMADNTKLSFGGEVQARFYTPGGLWNLVNLYHGLRINLQMNQFLSLGE